MSQTPLEHMALGCCRYRPRLRNAYTATWSHILRTTCALSDGFKSLQSGMQLTDQPELMEVTFFFCEIFGNLHLMRAYESEFIDQEKLQLYSNLSLCRENTDSEMYRFCFIEQFFSGSSNLFKKIDDSVV